MIVTVSTEICVSARSGADTVDKARGDRKTDDADEHGRPEAVWWCITTTRDRGNDEHQPAPPR